MHESWLRCRRHVHPQRSPWMLTTADPRSYHRRCRRYESRSQWVPLSSPSLYLGRASLTGRYRSCSFSFSCGSRASFPRQFVPEKPLSVPTSPGFPCWPSRRVSSWSGCTLQLSSSFDPGTWSASQLPGQDIQLFSRNQARIRAGGLPHVATAPLTSPRHIATLFA